jgi:hypothetical protein
LAVGPARPEDDDAKTPPQPNDRFVFLTGPKKGEVVSLDSLEAGGPQLQVFPVSPEGTARSRRPVRAATGSAATSPSACCSARRCMPS